MAQIVSWFMIFSLFLFDKDNGLS